MIKKYIKEDRGKFLLYKKKLLGKRKSFLRKPTLIIFQLMPLDGVQLKNANYRRTCALVNPKEITSSALYYGYRIGIRDSRGPVEREFNKNGKTLVEVSSLLIMGIIISARVIGLY